MALSGKVTALRLMHLSLQKNVTVNVINVSDKDWNDKPIETVIGTDGIDLIFGNDECQFD